MSVQYVKLGDVCAKDSSNIAQKDLKDCFGKYPVYGAGGYIQNVGFYHQEDEYIAIVKDGAGVGRAMILPAKSSVIGTMQYIIPDKNKVDIHYLYYAIINMALGKYFSGATIPHIYFKDYQKEIFKLPNLKIQKKIADNLKNIDLMIAKKNKQISLFNELVKSRFIEMFGDVNVNSKKWALLPLGELCKIVRGASPRPIEKFLGGTVPWIKIGDATENDDIFLTSTKEHIIQDGILKSRLVKANSLIFANCGVSLGFARIITFNGCIHDGWLALEDIDSRLNKIFLLQSLNQMTEYFRKLAPAGTQPNLNTSIMKTYKQIVPPLQLQKEFVSFLEQTNKSKLEIQKSIDKLEILKKSLMQQYFG